MEAGQEDRTSRIRDIFGGHTIIGGWTDQATLNTNTLAAINDATNGAPGVVATSSNGTTVLALQQSGGAITTPTLNALGSTNFVTIAAIPAISSYPATFNAIKYTALVGTRKAAKSI